VLIRAPGWHPRGPERNNCKRITLPVLADLGNHHIDDHNPSRLACSTIASVKSRLAEIRPRRMVDNYRLAIGKSLD
jgi:hypothetical protein